MGLSSLNTRLQDPLAVAWIQGVFPKVPQPCNPSLFAVPALGASCPSAIRCCETGASECLCRSLGLRGARERFFAFGR